MKKDAKIIVSAGIIILLLVFAWWLFEGLVKGGVEGNENLGNLWVVDFDGTEPRQLTDSCQAGFPVWSPDSQYIMYSTPQEPTGQNVTLIKVESPEQNILTLPEISSTLVAQWLPDGSQISYEGENGFYFSNPGGPPTKIADIEEDHRETPFAWSPDRSQIAYLFPSKEESARFIAHIFLLNVQSGNKRVLATERMYMAEPYWSSDGKHLAILNYGHTGELSVFEVHGDGQWVSQSLPEMGINRIFWSPDSQKIAVMQCPWGSGCGFNWPEEGVENVIFFIEPDGAERQDIIRGSVDLLGWEEDGSGIVYRKIEVGNDHIYRVERAGGEPELLAALPLGQTSPVLAPDGHGVVFQVDNCSSSIFKIGESNKIREGVLWLLHKIFPSINNPIMFLYLSILAFPGVVSVIMIIRQIASSEPTSRRYKALLVLSVVGTIIFWIAVGILLLLSYYAAAING
jgi:Tol biopolymer transport system component